ncbi:DUF4391 domain-containing protein [Phocaeicola plebeius]|uniref:DUF4391 domain-containing protein n=1 Tax=Phocaeicola plebeius TaxID=310297 RepID=UPI003FEDCDFC
MYGLPISTERKRQLPKKAIYAKFDLNSVQRESFDADIARIDIVAVICPATIPALSEGREVKEFYVLDVQMKRKEYDTKNTLLLSRLIAQHMVFALRYEEQVQFAIFHTKLFTTAWQPVGQASLPLSGLNLDTVWENIVKEIGRIEIANGHTLVEQIADNDQRAKLLAQIATLERKMANEKQPRRKREYFERIKKLKEQIL